MTCPRQCGQSKRQQGTGFQPACSQPERSFPPAQPVLGSSIPTLCTWHRENSWGFFQTWAAAEAKPVLPLEEAGEGLGTKVSRAGSHRGQELGPTESGTWAGQPRALAATAYRDSILARSCHWYPHPKGVEVS